LYKSIAGSIQPLLLVLYWLLILIYFFATIVYFFGNKSVHTDIFQTTFDALVTAKGVGYNHISDRIGTRFFSSILIIISAIFMAIPLKLTGSYLWKVVNHKDVVLLITRCQKKFSDYGFPEDNIKLIFKSMDRKINGYIQFDEFMDFCRIIGFLPIAGENGYTRVVEMFKEFDPKNFGYINLSGFTSGVVKSGYRHRYDILKSIQKEAVLERTVMKIDIVDRESDFQLESIVKKKNTSIQFLHNGTTISSASSSHSSFLG